MHAKTDIGAHGGSEHISIGEASVRTGLTQRTLRYWEQMGLVKPPTRVAGGQRLYSAEDLARIEHIQRMKELLGFSLGEIKSAVEAEEAREHVCKGNERGRNLGRTLERARQARNITLEQVRMVDEKLVQLRAMKRQLVRELTELDGTIARLDESQASVQEGSQTRG